MLIVSAKEVAVLKRTAMHVHCYCTRPFGVESRRQKLRPGVRGRRLVQSCGVVCATRSNSNQSVEFSVPCGIWDGSRTSSCLDKHDDDVVRLLSIIDMR